MNAINANFNNELNDINVINNNGYYSSNGMVCFTWGAGWGGGR